MNTMLKTRSIASLASVLLVAITMLFGCARKDSTPINLGFVGGLTGRTADLGTGGRNGAQLAIEQFNSTGGLNGRTINLIIKDDESDAERAKAVVGELIAANVPAVIGPFTSNVAVATVPLVNTAGIMMMAGTVTTNALIGKDDQFFRVIATTTQHSASMAEYLRSRRNVSHANLLVNLSNRAYTESWANDFATTFAKQGGNIGRRVEYTSAEDTQFDKLSAQLVADSPGAIILVTNAVDAAHTANQLVKRGSKALHVTAEWAGTGKLTDLGGTNVEGFIVPQYLDITSTQPAYLAFRNAYEQRFQQPAGFPAVAAFNATQVVLRALREQRADESIKQAVLRLKTFEGLQEPIVFDAFGDVQSPTYITEIRQGRYVPAK